MAWRVVARVTNFRPKPVRVRVRGSARVWVRVRDGVKEVPSLARLYCHPSPNLALT